MDNNVHSHILDIKVWSSLTDSTTDYANIENIVKDMFIQKKQIYNDIPIQWEKIIWSKYDKQFNLGDLAINSPFNNDISLMESVISTISEMNNYLHKSGKLSKNEKIIFKIVRPLVESLLLTESVGVIN
jgi:hypothetical protein